MCITSSFLFSAVIYFSSSSSLFTHYSISDGVVSSGHSSITLSKLYQLVSFSFSVISMCITPSYSLSAIISFLLSSYTLLHISWGCVIWSFFYYLIQGILMSFFSLSVIYLCIRSSSSLSTVIYFSSPFSLFTHYFISSGVV